MAIRNTCSQYGSLSRTLHWIILISIIGLLLYGAGMGYLPRNTTFLTIDDIRSAIKNLHKIYGIIVLGVAILFAIWSLSNTKPLYPNDMSSYERYAAQFVRFALYILMLSMPLSGWIMSTAANHIPYIGNIMLACPWVPHDYALAKLAKAMHYWLAWALFGFIALHTVAALRHHFIQKNTILTRMLFGKS